MPTMAGVRAYLTLNTLIADDEGPAALELAGQAYAAGIDALIIQDIGLASVLRRSVAGSCPFCQHPDDDRR